MADLTRVRQTFEQFANFGSSSAEKHETIDNAKFAKLCRDCGIIDKKCTSVDVDIIFKKVVRKGERRIDFAEFQKALKQLSEKKFRADDGGQQKVLALVAKSAPSTSGTLTEADGVFEKLTDTSLYTGTHKEKFDKDGNAKPLGNGINKTADLSQIVARKSGTTPVERSTAKSTGATKAGGKNPKASGQRA
ncbi:hypothetical protein MP228_003631 [Amoeboaphelidium protococcarum]|nr:hypothetical protein MP228_003631 [Amoeboaphelidium protococcarum]